MFVTNVVFSLILGTLKLETMLPSVNADHWLRRSSLTYSRYQKLPEPIRSLTSTNLSVNVILNVNLKYNSFILIHSFLSLTRLMTWSKRSYRQITLLLSEYSNWGLHIQERVKEERKKESGKGVITVNEDGEWERYYQERFWVLSGGRKWR